MPDGTYVMWEKVEQTLSEFHTDVLVIFDCCDAGYLSNRGTAHAFEYLAACGDKKQTKVPGPNSFTTALIWALRELKTATSFTTQALKDKIKAYPELPDKQEPLVFTRPENTAGPISIAPLGNMASTTHRRSSTVGLAPRPEECFFVDLRLFFNKNLSAPDGEHVAKMVSPAVRDKKLQFNATHVSVLKHGRLDAARARWSKARHSILFLKRLDRRPSEYEDDDVDDDDALSTSRRRAKNRPAEGISRRSQIPNAARIHARPATPVSDDHRSDIDTHINLPAVHVAPGIASSLDIHVPLVITPQDSSDDQGS